MGSLCCSSCRKPSEHKPLLQESSKKKYVTGNCELITIKTDYQSTNGTFSGNNVNLKERYTDPDDQCRIEKCPVLTRVLEILHEYERLDAMKNKQELDKWIHSYIQSLVNDHIHLNNHHSNELDIISEQLRTCDIGLCRYTTRHYRNTTPSTTQTDSDSITNFYTQTLDSLHFYLHHCFDTGLRVRALAMEHSVKKTEEKEEEKDRYFDAGFSRINRVILQTESVTNDIERFSTDKFNIKADNENNTYLDELCEFVQSESIKRGDVIKFDNFIRDEEYDTESIEYDLNMNTYGNGNIENNIKNIQHVEVIRRFIQEANISSLSFSIGLRFYYWNYYKSLTHLGEDEQVVKNSNINNYNDHSGYAVCDLFITPRYQSFKEEICFYKHISRLEYQKKVVVKVSRYMNANIVKKTKAVSSERNPYVKHYGIKWEEPMTFSHLLALVLYCDYTKLCTDFTSTFRPCNKYERLESIKNRNTCYYHFSKHLREAVEVYGQCSDGDYDKSSGEKVNQISGPFYSGVNKILTIPEFNIRLCSPTSTSVHIEVAIKFSGQQGMILQFDNPKRNSPTQCSYLRVFDVSWISQYNEEDERLFFGGFYPVNIQSVRIRHTQQNFENFIYSLHYLDTMITGGEQANVPVQKDDISVIKNLFDNALNKKTSFRYDRYIYKTFSAFINNKKQIVLDLDKLFQADNGFRELILQQMSRYEFSERAQIVRYDYANLFRPDMLSIFKNVNTIIVLTTSIGGQIYYSLSMNNLLSLIKSRSLETLIVKANTQTSKYSSGVSDIDNWIYSLWQSKQEQIEKLYKKSNYNIHMTKPHANAFELKISRKIQ